MLSRRALKLPRQKKNAFIVKKLRTDSHHTRQGELLTRPLSGQPRRISDALSRNGHIASCRARICSVVLDLGATL
jgi:hypothetical protein